MKHLIDIKSISKEEIENIINLAKEFKTGRKKSDVEKKTLSLMFYENSTRTRCSFEIAAQKLGMNIINFDANHSSLSKGESLKDTIENLYFLGVDAVVIRHSLSGIINNVMRLVNYPIHFVNGGDGTHAHPSQALLDYYTMLEKIGSVEGKKITIVGDVSHSRVAKSNISLLSKFGADIHLCAPTYLQFENEQAFNIHYHNEVKEAIEGSNVVMVLRVQNERHEKEGYPDSSEYKRLYEIDTELLKKYAAKDVILMHPGPANRNIEVSSELLDNQVGKTILEQAQNGVYVRMAILNTLLKGDNNAS
ncbi:TPA: aspartate carbamoyltransferase catalytic subunit [Candidatus Avigastranaerophilus faecigallinarum]|nr:aspartate carbamoyltransferase catalytic subunit [Candidatus Avigastranaerophilus faecigallinarum]